MNENQDAICRMQLQQCLKKIFIAVHAYIKKKKGLNQWSNIILFMNLEKEEPIKLIVSRTEIKLWAEINEMENRL